VGLRPSAEAGCKEAHAIDRAIRKICLKAGASKCPNHGCVSRWCKGASRIKCGGRVCSDPNLCGKTVGGTIIVCTGRAGNPAACGGPAFDLPFVLSPSELIALTILHEVEHTCGDKDHAPGTTRANAGSKPNPAEADARCMLCLPGTLPGYFNPGE